MALRLSTAILSDMGRLRRRNEDAVGELPHLGLVVVADGMGGCPAGDVASTLAVESLMAWLGGNHPGDAASRMETAIQFAHRQLRDNAERDLALQGMGTTLTALQVDGATGAAVVGHVGDSRAYRVSGGTMQALTRDQSWVQDRIDEGVLTLESARTHPLGSMLSQALGATPRVTPDVTALEVNPGDLFLLCTDGLTRVLEEKELLDTLRAPVSLSRRASSLVAAANRNGGPDNVTVALLQVEGDSDPAAP